MAQKHVQARVAERCAPIVSYGCRQKEAARADSLDTHARERGAGPPAARSLFALVERPSRVQPHLVPCFGVSPFAGTATDRTCLPVLLSWGCGRMRGRPFPGLLDALFRGVVGSSSHRVAEFSMTRDLASLPWSCSASSVRRVPCRA